MSAVAILPVQSHQIPTDLRAARRWVLWNLEMRDGKLTKIPYMATHPGRRADATDPKTWADFSTAIAASG
jgi:primase-polymerase (primpol)-like protein